MIQMGARSVYLKRCYPDQKEQIHIPPPIPEGERLYVGSNYQSSQADASVVLSSGVQRSLNQFVRGGRSLSVVRIVFGRSRAPQNHSPESPTLGKNTEEQECHTYGGPHPSHPYSTPKSTVARTQAIVIPTYTP